METIKKIWEDIFEKSLTQSISEISEKYLKPLGLQAIYIEYQFTENESKFFGVYLRNINLLKEGKITFSINREKLFSEMKHLGQIKKKNIRMQVHILTYHEIGHGLIDFINNMKFTEDEMKTLPYTKTLLSEKDNEKLAYDFGRSAEKQKTFEYNSVLEKSLYEILEIINKRETP
jgi:hypothetical protein